MRSLRLSWVWWKVLSDIIKVSDAVKDILERYPQARDSDKLLWLAYNCLYNDMKSHIGDYKSFKSWLMKPSTPVFESLSRCRRKLQAEYPHLEGNKVKRIEESESVKQWSLL